MAPQPASPREDDTSPAAQAPTKAQSNANANAGQASDDEALGPDTPLATLERIASGSRCWRAIDALAARVTRNDSDATAWTLLLNAGLGYSIQGIAVVEALLLARGVPPSVIVVTLMFVFALAMPVFMLTTVALGLSDVWLDYRRLDPPADPESS